jgi:hypothetical protein
MARDRGKYAPEVVVAPGKYDVEHSLGAWFYPATVLYRQI